MTRRTFDLTAPDPPAEPVEFEIKGLTSTGEPFVEVFTTVVHLPPAVIDDVSSTVVINDDGVAYYQRHETLKFLRTAICAADRDRWDALVRDPDRLVDLTALVSIMHWIAGTLLDRPTGPPSS